MKADSEEERAELIKDKKMSLSAEALCKGLPEEFSQYIDHTRSLGFEERPKYAQLRRRFRRLFAARGYKHDNVFDWTEKLFYAMCERPVEPSPQSSRKKDLAGEEGDDR